MDVTGEILIISKWQHIDDWSKWLVSKERGAYQERIDTLTNAEQNLRFIRINSGKTDCQKNLRILKRD